MVEAPQAARGDFAKRLEEAAASEVAKLLSEHVSEQVAAILGFDASDSIDHDKGFFTLGMDSLTSVGLKNRLENSLDCDLPSSVAFDYPTVRSLVEYLAAEVVSGDAEEEDTREDQASHQDARPAGEQLSDLDLLSERELEERLIKKLESLDY